MLLFTMISTVEAPFALVLEADKSNSFTFNGIKIDTADIIFQVQSDKIRKDKDLYDGMGHYNVRSIKNQNGLKKLLNYYQADSVIYGYRLSIKPKQLQTALLKELTKLYGRCTKNPNTDNGLYWNLKNLHRYVLFAPDYNMLIVLDNTHLSKTCYHDNMNGTLDFGGCNIDQYNADLFK